ncbi:hypothetical protein [Bradyrhizobium sp. S3.2.12]|uniref:hypothetical protein n=1 Tax=Bradyrhizobium sp. S3.2.12 TaxID=3156387 RepID=UPI00339702BB
MIDPDEHLMKLRDATGVSFHPVSALRAIENGFAAYAAHASEHLLHPRNPAIPVLST